jgi:hypothetical protein
MNAAEILSALALPPQALVDRRVPKKMLTEQGDFTAADKRRLLDGIEELTWVAALKPSNIGVPAFRDETCEYLEIAVLTATLRPAARAARFPVRVLELIHRAIPYPVLLIAEQAGAVHLSVAHKRWSQGEGGKVVVDSMRGVELSGGSPDSGSPPAEEAAFLASLSISRLPTAHLYALYDGWLEGFIALEAARIVGSFKPPVTSEESATLRQGLEEHSRIARQLVALRAQARKEKQLNRRVEINLSVQRLEAELAAEIATLSAAMKA